MPPTPEQLAAMEHWLGRVRGVVIALADVLSPEALDHANHLIEHGEAPLGLEALTWSIVNERVQVPAWTIDAIYELGGSINDPDGLPPNLRDFAAES